jgi:poly-gamma-glutamate synthesis protein (capsule biosynthesis protein)
MKLILMGDVNLMDVTDPAEPFRKILGELHAADVVFVNLECCFYLPALRRSDANEGFFADPVVGGGALKLASIHAVGIANNVNYGATSIAASIARLDEVGILHTGAGPNLTAARAPAVVERCGRCGRRCVARAPGAAGPWRVGKRMGSTPTMSRAH